MTISSDSQLPNGTILYEQAMENLRVPNDNPPHYNLRILYAQLLEQCGGLLERGGLAPSFDPVNLPANVAKQLLDSCINLEYIFVLRTRKLSGREFSGDVVAFELASGKHIGGFPVSFTSEGRTDTVTDTTRTPNPRRVGGRTRNTTKVTTMTHSVNADDAQLRSDLAEEIERSIKQLVPNVQWRTAA